METRRFGRAGHLSTIAIFGAAALSKITRADAGEVMEMVIEAGINNIDIAPSCGEAEMWAGPWMQRERGRFFQGCKTTNYSPLSKAEREVMVKTGDQFEPLFGWEKVKI